MGPMRALVTCLIVAPLLVGHAEATSITVFYGDADGFGVGAVGTMDPTVSNAEVGEAEDTDVRLIGDAFGSLDAFEPTGSFDAFAIPGGETIISAMLTMSAGAWDVGDAPVDGVGSNQILLDGLSIPTTFFAMFTANNAGEFGASNSAIETKSTALPNIFFSLLADGSVSLNGTNLSEEGGSGSFQIDFLRLDIETQQTDVVPEPTSMFLLGTGLAGMAVRRYRRKRS